MMNICKQLPAIPHPFYIFPLSQLYSASVFDQIPIHVLIITRTIEAKCSLRSKISPNDSDMAETRDLAAFDDNSIVIYRKQN